MKKIELRNIHLRTGDRAGDIASLDFKGCAIFKDKFTKVRGEILEQSMAIIAELDHFFDTLNIQVHASKPGEDFMDKWELFRESLHKLPEFKPSTKNLRRDVHTVINKRNKYVHADLGFTNNQPEIKYKKEGKIVTEPIDAEILDKDMEFFEKVKGDLRSLNISKYRADEIYKETMPFTIIKWILAMEIALTILFLYLFVSQLPEGLSWFYLGMFLLFAMVTALIANFRALNISITSRSITVAYGRIRYSVPWDRIDDCYSDKGSGIRYGGWGIRMARVKGKWLLVYAVTNCPRVILDLNKDRFGRFIFSTRHPEEVVNIVKGQVR